MHEGNYLAQRLAQAGSQILNKTFIQIEISNQKVTFSQFFFNAERSAQFLADLAVTPGDTVLVYAPKSVASIELYFGCLLAGAIYTPINPAIPPEELGYFIQDAQPKLVICDEARLSACLEACGSACPVMTINEDESGSFVERRDAYSVGFKAVSREAHDPAAILYTSGTTGRPKGVVHTHKSLWSNAEVLARSWHFQETDVLIHALPIFHLHGLFTAMNVLLAVGASCFYLAKFNTDQVLKVMPQSTVMMGVPPFYMALLKDSRLRNAAKNMRVFISGSAPMLPQTHHAWQQATGKMILERYGMTECSMIASNPYNAERKPNSVGFPLEGTEVRITDMKSGAPLSQGETGMIEIRGPNLFEEYFKKPEKTAEDMREDGFFISGDFGRYDEDGYLYVLGRVKDAIFTKSGVVMPKEIEEWIDQQPGVSESAVISVPHPDNGDLPVALIVGSNLNVASIGAAASQKFPAYKAPFRYVVLSDLPRNAMGKVQKAELRATHKNLLKGEFVE